MSAAPPDHALNAEASRRLRRLAQREDRPIANVARDLLSETLMGRDALVATDVPFAGFVVDTAVRAEGLAQLARDFGGARLAAPIATETELVADAVRRADELERRAEQASIRLADAEHDAARQVPLAERFAGHDEMLTALGLLPTQTADRPVVDDLSRYDLDEAMRAVLGISTDREA